MVKSKRTVRALAVMLLSLLLLIGTITPSSARAESDYPFDQSNVLDDLESSEDFDIINYPYDYAGTYKTPCIMNFVEWCYSPFRSGDFALYVYFYNPQNLKIDVGSMSNRIQIATKYSDEIITKDSIPTDYETFQLIYCNKSERTNYEGLFYKFRIIDHKSADGKTIETRVNSLERRYDVSGVTFAQENGAIKEYTVGGTYRFTGYAEGYGANEFNGNTLQNTGFTPLETIRLEVHPTLFRSSASSSEEYHQNDLNSVYFSVPEKYFTQYGALQKIKAEWYEYKTKDIMILKNQTAYNQIAPYIGKNIGENTDAIDLSYYTYRKEYSGTYSHYGTTYNQPMRKNVSGGDRDTYDRMIDTLYWAFLSSDGNVSAEQVRNYIMNYNKSFNTGKLPIGNGQISADLFSDEVDAGRTRGYNIREFDAGDEINLLYYDATLDGWERFWNTITGKPIDIAANVSPIDANISKDIFGLSEDVISQTLLIGKEDVTDFKNFYNAAAEKNELTVLFRFAQTDYYSEGLYAIDNDAFITASKKGETANLSQMTVFLDFKIIHLTFQADGEYTVIPVTQDPINIINGITPPANGTFGGWLSSVLKQIGAWGVLVLAIIAGALMLWVISKICKGIASAHWVVKIILILLLAGVITGCVFAGIWVADVITGLGGL